MPDVNVSLHSSYTVDIAVLVLCVMVGLQLFLIISDVFPVLMDLPTLFQCIFRHSYDHQQ